MKERPILFSAPMVRTVLAGTKTQTRRVVKPQPASSMPPGWTWKRLGVEGWYAVNGPHRSECIGQCPYGAPGDRLWVREAWRAMSEHNLRKPSELPQGTPIVHEASRHPDTGFGKLRPGMFMPRAASRLTLEVTGVRVERLQAISERDCEIELGVAPFSLGDEAYPRFRNLWERINGETSWITDPWVWVVEFRRVPITQLFGAGIPDGASGSDAHLERALESGE